MLRLYVASATWAIWIVELDLGSDRYVDHDRRHAHRLNNRPFQMRGDHHDICLIRHPLCDSLLF